jgi:hypothetical protein
MATFPSTRQRGSCVVPVPDVPVIHVSPCARQHLRPAELIGFYILCFRRPTPTAAKVAKCAFRKARQSRCKMVARVRKVNTGGGAFGLAGGAGLALLITSPAAPVSWCERTPNLGQAASRGNRRLTDIVAQRNSIPVIQEKTSAATAITKTKIANYATPSLAFLCSSGVSRFPSRISSKRRAEKRRGCARIPNRLDRRSASFETAAFAAFSG